MTSSLIAVALIALSVHPKLGNAARSDQDGQEEGSGCAGGDMPPRPETQKNVGFSVK